MSPEPSTPPNTRSSSRRSIPKNLAMVGIAVLLGIAIGLGLWVPLWVDERSHINHMTKLAIRSVHADIAIDLEDEILAVIRLANLVTTEEEGSDAARRFNAKLFLADHPSYAALFWTDPAYNVTWVVRQRGDMGKGFHPGTDNSLKAALQSALELGHRQRQGSERTRQPSITPNSYRNQEEATLSPAFRLANGEWGCRIVVPVHSDKGVMGFLVAVFEVRKAFDIILSDHSEIGYAVAVLEGNQELYRMHGVNDRRQRFAQDADIRLRGANWHVRIWPEAELLEEIRSKLPEVTLGFGTLLGILLVLTVHFATRARATSRELQRANDEMETRVEERTAEVHELSGRLLQAQDEERRRVARELHDSTNQVLAGVSFYLEKAISLVDKQSQSAGEGLQSALRESLDQSAKFLEQAASEVRTISYLLHPPMLDDLGLDYVVRWFAVGFSQRSGVKVDLDIQPDLGRLPHQLELTLFRIVQEALTNVHRHSGSPTARILIARNQSRVTLEVSDQGCGIPQGAMEVGGSRVAALGMGIRGMQERLRQLGAVLEITSSNCGTTIRALFPLSPGKQTNTRSESSRSVSTTIS